MVKECGEKECRFVEKTNGGLVKKCDIKLLLDNVFVVVDVVGFEICCDGGKFSLYVVLSVGYVFDVCEGE